MGNCFSKDHGESGEERVSTVPAASTTATTAAKPNGKEKVAPLKPKTLASGRTDITNLKDEQIDTEKAAALFDMSLTVIDYFQKAADVTEMVLPSPLGSALEKITNVLGVLKVRPEVPVMRIHL